ncbi:UBX domain-containing protein 8 isoform X1 [Alosa pseudoharengus]|uniref:UBX domain-containing protein 8 isoform X1 n=1 Tax=Alosa pseudoharengus TaxID=34774 RepID=UPI003F8BCC2C
MSVVGNPCASLCAVAILFFCCISWKHSIVGVRDALFLAGRTFLLLCFITFASYLYPRMKALLFPPPCQEETEGPEDAEARLKQDIARREQQAKLNNKASHYQENVQKPKQEARLRKKEDNFYAMTGETWRLTEGQQLREGELGDQEDMEEQDELTAQQRAIRRRKLPAMAYQGPAKKDPPLAKRVIVLPDEPPVDAEGVVNVALRCLSGRTLKRRFLKSHPSTVLVDWMFKSGYHPTVYAICEPYPRRPLQTEEHLTLEDVGIVRNTVLNVEEKDPSTT